MNVIRQKRWVGTVALSAVAILAIAACGSSKTTKAATTPTGGATSPTASTAAPTGTPIVFYEITALNTPLGSFPSAGAAEKAAARDINAAGGINGHPLEVQICNGGADPNLEVQCARKAVASGAVASGGSFFISNPSGDLAVLKAGGLPAIGNSVSSFDEISSTDDFPLDSGPYNPFGCLALPKAGLIKKLAIMASDIPPIKAGAAGVIGAAQAGGIAVSPLITLPTTSPDVTSQIQQATNSGANGVQLFATEPQAVQVLAASASLGKNLTFCTSDGLIESSDLVKLGTAASNFYLASTMPSITDTGNAGIARYLSDMAAEAASGDSAAKFDASTYNSVSLRAWAAVQAFAEIAKTISGPVTRASVLTAIRSATDVTTYGVFPPINFSKPASPKFPGLFNLNISILKWDPSKKQFDPTSLTYDATAAAAAGPPPAP